MRIYIFKSETRKDLRAFAGDLTGSRLPQNHGPWTATGAIGPDSAPPYNFSRDAIEEAISSKPSVFGFEPCERFRPVVRGTSWSLLLYRL